MLTRQVFGKMLFHTLMWRWIGVQKSTKFLSVLDPRSICLQFFTIMLYTTFHFVVYPYKYVKL